MQDDYQTENKDKPENSYPNNSYNNLNKSQKIAAAVLAFFAFFVIFMWAVQFNKSIKRPFEYKDGTDQNNQTDFCQGEQCGQQSEQDLRAKDTDNDGLSDWDELNIYKTSPYLEDSDSDGFGDKQEIDNNKDPNCPSGKDCYSSVLNSEEYKADKDTYNLSSDDSLKGFNSDQEEKIKSGQDKNLQNVLSGQKDASSLRKLLIEAGMDEKTLSQISDQELMESYQEILKD